MNRLIEVPPAGQLQFEQALVDGRYPKGTRFDAAFVQAQTQLDAQQAAFVLDVAFRKGLLARAEQGAFIRNQQTPPHITSVFQHAEKVGLKPKSIVRSVEKVAASPLAAEKLRIPVGAPVYEQKRSRLINGHVVANQCNSIPYLVTPELETIDLKHTSFQVTLENKYHAVVHRIREDFSLAAPTAEDRQVLGLAGGDRVLVVHRLSLSATDMPLVWADLHVDPAHFHLVAALWPQAAQLLESGGVN